MSTVDLKYDVPVEVSKKAYDIIMNYYPGACFGRDENGKYYIKLASISYKSVIEDVIKHHSK